MAETQAAVEALTVISRFEVRRRRYLGPDGTPVAGLPDFAAEASALVPLYRAMVLTRAFDVKAVALQRTGRLGTYAVSLGQEAVSVGAASAMRREDVLLPSYRDTGMLLWRGVKMEEILLYWGGDERGSHWSGPAHDFPYCVPVGSQAPHAAGVAYALKLRKEPRVAVCMVGDGATSKGDVYEAMNFAGVHKLPLVFVINNNQWAISVPLKLQTACSTLAQKAIAAGFDGEQVDGNDVLAVRAAAEEAIAAARARDQAGTAGDDAKRELDRLKKKVAELESKAAAPTTGPDPAALAADLEKEKRASKEAADKAAAAERQLKSLQAELEAAKTDAQKARAEAERAKTAAANVEATTVSAAPAALAASGEIQQKAREVYDAINDVLSEIRNNAMLVQGEVDNLGGGGGDAARIIKDTVEALMGNAEDAKGALRGLKDLAES